MRGCTLIASPETASWNHPPRLRQAESDFDDGHESDSDDSGRSPLPSQAVLLGLLLYTISTVFGASTSIIVKLLGGELVHGFRLCSLATWGDAQPPWRNCNSALPPRRPPAQPV